jgi:hypothetical protein
VLVKTAADAHISIVDLFIVRFALPSARAPDRLPVQCRRLTSPLAASRETVCARTTMTIGTGRWFNSPRGYSFIQPEDGSKDLVGQTMATLKNN